MDCNMANKQLISEIQTFVITQMYNALKTEKQVNFQTLSDAIKAKFPTEKFNWITAVRGPIQHFLSKGYMKRDTSNLRVEIYTAA